MYVKSTRISSVVYHYVGIYIKWKEACHMGWSTGAMSELGRNLFERITKEYSENTSSRMGDGLTPRPAFSGWDRRWSGREKNPVSFYSSNGETPPTMNPGLAKRRPLQPQMPGLETRRVFFFVFSSPAFANDSVQRPA